MAGGDYVGAIEKFRQAIDLEPTSVPLRFALGTAYSFLDRRSEAIAQFRWVVANAAAESTEYRESRRWLIRVGALEESANFQAKVEDSVDAARKADPASLGTISGRTEWPGVTPEHNIPLRISMLGTEESTRAVQRRADILMGQTFEFKDIPEGQYRILGIYDDRAFDRLPILADALIDAGCDDEQILEHCRAPGPHVRGCWVVDLVLGKE